MPGLCIMATYLMYGIDPEELNDSEKEKIVSDSSDHVDQIWQVYAITKNVFGFKYLTSSLLKN